MKLPQITDAQKAKAKEQATKAMGFAATWAKANTISAVLPWLIVIGIGCGFCGFLFGLFVGLIF